ncbi:unnamed protein product [Caenorhabditis bovis]|uniref:GSKIP domain-containing protein n=1 Tax=Caenorhabditis bovis TaxID=2654633 RepID=A0A8S1F7P5_9PELO|nr:unnamed protein product [Caenorhabditis bovis]
MDGQQPPESPPNSPNCEKEAASCICSSVPIALSANTLADTLKVSPLYKQQDSARWTAAAQVYRSSRAVSPTQDEKFSFDGPPSELINQIKTPRVGAARTPLSLEDIAEINRKRHGKEGGIIAPSSDAGPLELEAIAAVHELAHEVENICVSEMLPRTSDLIFVNVKTQEGAPYTLELTMKGWRIASTHTDCMNGDYTRIELHTKYFQNARELLKFISPDHATKFNECLAKRLQQIAEISAQ